LFKILHDALSVELNLGKSKYTGMKYLILIAIIYGIYRFAQMQKTLDTRKRDQLNQEDDDGSFTDYEEVD